MNNRNKASSADQTQIFGEDRTAVFHTMDAQEYDDSDVEEEDAEEEIYEEDDDDNLLARIKEKKQRKEEAKRKLEQDDDEEEDEDDPGKSAKMNKIITYVIIGIVGICIIAGAFFGVKYALSNSLAEVMIRKRQRIKAVLVQRIRNRTKAISKRIPIRVMTRMKRKRMKSRPIRQKRLSCRNSWISMNLS